MAHVVELWVKHPEHKSQKTLALPLCWWYAPRVGDSPAASTLFCQGSLVLGPIALFPHCCCPPRPVGSHPLRSRCWGKGACSYPGPGMLPGAGTVHRGPRRGLCVCTSTHPHACFFPQRETAPNRARAGGGSLEGFNC